MHKKNLTLQESFNVIYLISPKCHLIRVFFLSLISAPMMHRVTAAVSSSHVTRRDVPVGIKRKKKRKRNISAHIQN